MRKGRRGGWFATALATLLLLVIGTAIGRDLALGPFSQPLGFAPLRLDLYIVSVAIGVTTNVLGLIGAFLGVVLFRVL